MSNLQRGPNAGISGLVELPGASAKFECRLYRWSPRLVGSTKPRAGRSSTDAWERTRWLTSSGNIALTGSIPPKGVPQPDAWRGQEGTLTVKIAVGKTIAYPIKVLEHGFDFDEKKQDFPTIIIAARITGEPDYSAGWGTQPTATDASKADEAQWLGSVKTMDPNGLQSSATRLIDIWGTLTNSDAAEQTKLVAVISAASPPITTPHNLKLKTSSFQRDALDGGTITEVWGLTDTAEDWINPQTQTTVDPNKMQTGGTVAAINATPTIPTVSGNTLVERTTRTVEINDSKTGKVTEFGQLNTQDDITYPGTHKDIDVSDLTSTGISTSIFANGGSAAAAPDWSADGIQPVKHYEIRHNRDEWKAIDEYAKDTSEQSWEQEHSNEVTDTGQLASTAESGAVDDATPPAPVNTNLVIRYQRVQNITHDHVGYVDVYGLRTTTQDVEFDETEARIDPIGIESEGRDTNVYDSTGGVPSDASPPDGSLKVSATTIKRINQIRSKKITYFDVNASDEKWLFARTRVSADPSLIKTLNIKGAVFVRQDGTPNPPGATGLVLNRTELFDITSPDTSDLRGVLWFYTQTTSADDEIFPRTRTETDPDGLESRAVSGAIVTTGAGLGSPSAPAADLKLDHWTDAPLTDAAASNKSIRLYFWELTTSAERIERAGTEAYDDPNKLESKAQETIVFDDGTTPPTDGDETITPPTDTEFDGADYQQLNDGKWKAALKWAINNSKNLWERLKKKVTTDPGHVVPIAIVPKVLALNTAVDTGDTYNPDSTNLSFHSCEVIPLSATQEVQIYTFRPLSPKDESQESYKEIVDDPVTFLVGDDKREIIDGNATTAAPSVSGQVCTWRMTQKIGRATYRHRFKFGFRSLGDGHEADNTFTEVDASALESEALTADVWLVSGGAPATPTLSGYVLIKYRDKEIENPLYRLRIYFWGLVTTAQKITFGRSVGKSNGVDTEIDTTTIVTSAASTLAAEEATAFAAAKTNAEFAGFEIVQRTDGKYVKTIRTKKDDKTFHSDRISNYAASTKARPQAGFEVAGAFGNPAAFVHAMVEGPALAPPSGYTSATLIPIEFDRTVGEFKLRRRYNKTVAEFQALVVTWNAIRHKVIAQPFHKSTAYEAKYISFELPDGLNIGIDATGARGIAVDHVFKTDSWMHFNDQNIPIGSMGVFSAPISNSGFGPASVFDPNATLVWPLVDAGNFAVLLA